MSYRKLAFPQCCWPTAPSRDSKVYSNICSLSYGDESPTGKTRTHDPTVEADLTQEREIPDGLELSNKSGMR